jgi:hypothetical protein
VDNAHYDCTDALGCETALSAASCGDCGQACDSSQHCELVGNGYACVEGASCPATAPNLCESTCIDWDDNALYCGDCATSCAQLQNAVPTCEGGDCTLECIAPYENCDGVEATGCESDTTTDPNNCGGCEGEGGVDCEDPPHADPVCANGTCGFRCDADYANCTNAPGCETYLRMQGNCGGCGVTCGTLSTCCTNLNPPRCVGLGLCL